MIRTVIAVLLVLGLAVAADAAQDTSKRSSGASASAGTPINLNTASQIDLEAVGGLLRREAAAVIKYREKYGRFKTIDDLKKVPGLDFRKIDTRRDAMVVM